MDASLRSISLLSGAVRGVGFMIIPPLVAIQLIKTIGSPTQDAENDGIPLHSIPGRNEFNVHLQVVLCSGHSHHAARYKQTRRPLFSR